MRPTRFARWRAACSEDGVSAVIVAVVVVVLFGFTALAVDVARLYEERRELQRTADVSALSGAQRLMAGKAEAAATGQEYVTVNPSVHHAAYDEETDDVIPQRLADGDPGCDVDGTRYDCVEVIVRARSFDFYFARVLGFDGLYFSSGNAVGAHATAVAGAGAPGGEKLVPWVVIDCPHPVYDGGASDAPVTYEQIAATVEAAYPGRCPYEYSTAGWNGPREQLFLDTGTGQGGNFQAVDLAGEPCPPPATPDGLFPRSAGAGASDYSDFLAGWASPVIPCHIAKGARAYPKTGVMVGPTKQGLDARGVSTSTCMNEGSFNATVQDPDGDGIYQILDHRNPCLVALLLAVHVDPANAAVETDVPGGSRILEFQHPDPLDADGDGEDWRFAPPDNGASKPLLMRRFAMFYITALGNAQQPYEGLFLRVVDSGNAELDGTPCTDADGICVVKLAA